MLEIATLGLLQREPVHGYRLKQTLELFMSGCISVNYGSIYPLLKRLEEAGYIQTLAEEQGEAGSSRKIYSITDKGRDRWRQKMLEHPHESKVNSRSRFMIKFFFFSHLESAERRKLIEHRLRVCQLALEDKEDIECHKVPEDPYQASVWYFWKDGLETEIQWLTEQLAKERKNQLLETKTE